MLEIFLPTDIYKNIYEITPDFLKSTGIKALILDIDNTLVTYDDPKPTESVSKWLDTMHENGIQTAFVSNNHYERVNEFCSGLGCYYHSDAHKPSAEYLYEAMKFMKTGIDDTASVGDQLFTDVWAAKRIGMRSYLVPPIKDKKTPFFKFKRLLEKPFLRKFAKQKEKRYGKQ